VTRERRGHAETKLFKEVSFEITFQGNTEHHRKEGRGSKNQGMSRKEILQQGMTGQIPRK
jgi:hypothetical protein